MTYKGVIFDLDGTLVNSIKDIADAMNIVLNRYNFPQHDYETYKTFVGSGIKTLVIRALPEHHQNEMQINLCFEAMKTIYAERCTNKTKVYDGIHTLIEKLQQHGIKQSILSNKADVLTKKVASQVLPDYFESVVGLTTEALKKPNPKVALDLCKKMNLAPEEVIFVGDSEADIQTAKSANMLAVGVSWGFRSKEELTKQGAKHIINHPLELITLRG